MAEVVLRMPALKARIGLGKTEIYNLVRDGELPAPIKLGPRASGWLESEIDAWILSRPRKENVGGRD